MVPGLILAAGRSSRMGRAKALLRVAPDGDTFVTRLARSLVEGGVTSVFVVGRPDDDPLQRELLAASVQFIPNADADRGQLSSIVAGVDAVDAPGVAGLLVTPVDAPLVSPATIRALLTAFAEQRAPVVRAAYRGRHGHPVIFARALFDDLRRADASIGAKAVVRAYAATRLDLDVDDPAVVQDIDNPDDYAKAITNPST
jgi:molybdenum cofactor cytidylyltransferase